MAIVFELPLFVVGLTRIGIITTAQLRRDAADRLLRRRCVAVALPGVDPVTTIFEAIPLLVLYEGSIWPPSCSTGAPPRSAANVATLLTGAVSAEWVAARRRAADRERAGAVRGRRDRRGDRGPRRAPLRRGGDRPGIRERALAPRVRGLRRLRRRPAVRPVDQDARRAQGRLDRRRHARGRASRRRSTRFAAGITTTADYCFSGAAATAATELGLRAIVYLEVFAPDPARPSGSSEEKRPARRRERARAHRVSPHAPYTCSLDIYRWCLSLGIPVGTHLAESANENEWLQHGSGPLSAIAPLLVPPTGRRPFATLGAAARARAPLRPLRRGRARGRSRSSPSATCPSPTARARTRSSAAASRRSPSCARRASASGLGTDSPGLDPVLRRLRGDADGDLRRPGAGTARRRRCSRPMPSGWRRSMRPAPCDSTIGWVP